MEILSVTNIQLLLHKSPTDLTVKTHQSTKSANFISSDVSFFPSKRCFARCLKTEIIEIWRIKADNNGCDSFDRLRKLKSDGVSSLACNKNKEATFEYAVGFSTGAVKVVELNSKNTCKANFSADPGSKASVISLDYSNDGQYLSSVHENGVISIFGLTTKIKSDSIKLDRDSTLARFHPSKRFHLAVASFRGSVSIYDIATKKLSFQQKDAHDAPCRDLAMPEAIPDRLLTCGCDSIIKIFDTRKKATGLQIESYCGLSSISVTNCGGFFVVGNLKGDILSYDMRNLRQPLAKMMIGTELVSRVSFLPHSTEEFPTMSQKDSTNSFSEDLPEPPVSVDEFSIDEMIGLQRGRISELERSVVSRVSAISSRESKGQRLSEQFGNNAANALKDISFSSDTSFQDANDDVPEIEMKTAPNKNDRKRLSNGKKESLPSRRASFMPSPLSSLHQIREELDKENFGSSINLVSTPTLTSTGLPRFSSTPATVVKITKQPPSPKEASISCEIIDVDAIDNSEKNTEKEQPEQLGKSSENSQAHASTETIVPPAISSQHVLDFKKELEAMKSSIIEQVGEKVRLEVGSLAMDVTQRHFAMQSFNFNLNRQLHERIQMIEESMAMLLTDDFKINRILELQEENRQLRESLDEITRRSRF